MLEVRSIDAFYGQSHVLYSVSLSVGAGERVAVLGRNGAGKSTLLKSIMNADPRVEGTIRFDGKTLDGLPSHRRAKLGLALVPEDRRIFPHITVEENIAMARFATPVGSAKVDVEAVVSRFPMLAPLKARLGSQLSGGQQQMVAVARGIAASPRLILLDEPTEGLAPIIVEQLAEEIRSAFSGNVGLLLCEQNIWFARQCTDYVHVMDAGQIVFSGTWCEFDAADKVKSTHLAI